MAKPTPKVVKLSDLVPDTRNANKGTLRGLAMLDDSIREDGIGRGILLDRNNQIIGGNKTVDRLVDLGFEEVIIVPTDGKQLVATQRVDVDLDSPQGRRMALRDNRVGEVDLEFDPDVLAQLADEGIDLSKLWNEGELAPLLNQGEPLDYQAAWQGMPEFEQNASNAFKTLIVHFDTEDDVKEFSDLIGQSITMKTRYIWHPAKPDKDNTQYRVKDES